ncbi:MAG: rhamnulokinase family protein [Solirubrobacteraceae bacterium]
MTEVRRLAAIDLGAESGRVVVGELDGEHVSLRVVHRFDNRPLWLPDGLHWNLPALFAQALEGLRVAAADGPLDGVGIDGWGCDYALLDAGGRALGLPFHYRDPRRTSPEVMAGAHARLGRDELYRATGIQTMAINTVFQLFAERGGAALSAAQRIALIPDLFGLWLTGSLANEATIASTTGLLDARAPRWAQDVIAALDLPAAPFAGPVVAAGCELGPVLEGHRADAGDAVATPVRTVAGHDTASAFAATPLAGPGAAVLSSGTWSLLGVELDAPELGAGAAAVNLTNERGVGGTVRLLRNVMGLWLVQECRRAWSAAGRAPDYGELQTLAGEARADVALFDPDDRSLLRGGDMPGRIANLCTAAGQPAPEGQGELLRCILVSLACKYRWVLDQLERVSRRRVSVVHVVGGGARNTLLCRLTADLTGRPVLAGPIEATALGNVLVQALALGEVSDLTDLRRLAARSVSLVRFEPEATPLATETYQRFLSVTGKEICCA